MKKVCRKSIITTLLTVFACVLAVVAVFAFMPTSKKADAEGEPSVWNGDLAAAGWGVEHTAPVTGIASTDETQKSTKPSGYVATFDETDESKVAKVTISDAASLAYFAREIYEFSANYEGCEVSLTTDIDLDNKLWMPIGLDNRKNKDSNGIISLYLSFKGTFDGENHTISNLNGTKFAEALVAKTVDAKEQLYIEVGDNSVFIPSDDNEFSYGLFGVTANTTIKNIKLPQFSLDLTDVTTTYGGKKIEADGVGGIVGFAGGSITIDNCVVGTPKTDENKNELDINVTRCTGGILGRAYVGIYESGNLGNAQSPTDPLIATNPVIIKNCTSYLNIGTSADKAQKGGILGYANNCSKIEFDNCKNYGNITGEYVGGITSFLQQSPRLEAIFKDCYNEGNITGTDRGVGGIIGYIAKDSSGGTVTFNNCVNKGDILAITKDTSGKYQMAGGISGGIIGGVEQLDEPQPMGSVVTVFADNLYNYGKVTGAAGKDQSGVEVSDVHIKYAGGIFGQLGIGEKTYNVSNDWLNSTDANKENAYPYSVIKLNNIVNCGEVTAAGEYRGQYLYIGGAIGCMSHNQTIPGQTSRVYVDTLINTCGSVNTIDYCGTHAANPHDTRTGVQYRELEKRENIASSVPVAELKYEDGGKTVTGITGKDASGADINGDFKVVIPNKVTKIADKAFAGKGVFADKGIDVDSSNRHSLPHLYSASTQHLVAVEFAENSTLQTIGQLAFAGTDIKEVVLPESVTEIAFGAFAQTQLEKVVINSAAVVADSAFGNNNFLKQVEIKDDSITFGNNTFDKMSDVDQIIIASSQAQFNELSNKDFKARLTYPVTIEYYDFGTGTAVKKGEEKRLHGKPYNFAFNETTGIWEENGVIAFVGLPEFGSATPWYADSTCNGEPLTLTSPALTNLLNGDANIVKLYTRTIGGGDAFIARTDIVYGTRYELGAINALLAPSSKRVTNETVAITKFNDSTESLPASIYYAGKYTVTITPAEDAEGNPVELTITVNKAPVELSAMNALQWRVNDATLSDGPVYIKDGMPTLVRPDGGNYTVEAAIESLVRVRGEEQTLGLTGEGFTAAVKEGSSAKGLAIGKYTTEYTLTADNNHTLELKGAIVNGGARGLTVTRNEDGTATVTKVWYIVAMGNWLVDENGNDYDIADRVYGSDASIKAPLLRHSDENTFAQIEYSLTRSGYNGAAFGHADFEKYLNKSMPAGSYTLRVKAPAVTYYEAYDEDNHPIGDPIVCPTFTQDITFEVAAATLSSDQGIGHSLNGAQFGYILGETEVSEANKVIVDSINGGLENIRRNLPTVADSHWTLSNDPVAIEVALVSDKTNVYSAFTRPDAVGVYDYYYRIRIDNYNIVDRDAQGDPLGFRLAVYGVVDLPSVASHQYTGATQTAFIADGEQYRVVRNDGGIHAGTYEVEVELIHPECYIWIDQTLDGEHPALRTLDFVIEQAVNAWTRLPNIVNWNYASFDADVNRIRAVPLYLDANSELYFKVATDEAGENVLSGLGHVTVDRNGKISDATVIARLNELAVGRYYLVSVVAETSDYAAMEQSIAFNVAKAYNAWASGEDALVLPSWVEGDYDPAVNTIKVQPEHGVANIRITDMDGNEYYNSVTGVNNLATAPVGKYMLIAWVDASDNYQALAERTFTFEVLETIGLPWWGTLLIVLGVLAVISAILFVLWKRGVFQILTGKLVLAIRTKATVDATIAAVRASKKADEAKAAIAAAKAKERASERRAKAQAERALPVEERAAALEAKAQAAAAKADKMRARAEAMQARAARMKEEAGVISADAEAVEVEETKAPEAVEETKANAVEETKTPEVAETKATKVAETNAVEETPVAENSEKDNVAPEAEAPTESEAEAAATAQEDSAE